MFVAFVKDRMRSILELFLFWKRGKFCFGDLLLGGSSSELQSDLVWTVKKGLEPRLSGRHDWEGDLFAGFKRCTINAVQSQ